MKTGSRLLAAVLIVAAALSVAGRGAGAAGVALSSDGASSPVPPVPLVPSVRRYGCHAQCLVIDVMSRLVANYGPMSGTSELSVVEAFYDLQRACMSAQGVESDDADRVDYYLARRFTFSRIDERGDSGQRSSSSASDESAAAAIRRGFFRYVAVAAASRSSRRDSHSSWSSRTEQGVGFEIEPAGAFDGVSCGAFEENPGGRPKYLGRERPLG